MSLHAIIALLTVVRCFDSGQMWLLKNFSSPRDRYGIALTLFRISKLYIS